MSASSISNATPGLPHTCLRASYERVRSLPLDLQIEDCVDNLTHPHVLVDEMLDAFDAVTMAFDRHEGPVPQPRAESRVRPATGPDAPYFYPGRDLSVLGSRRAFTVLATDLDPLSGMRCDSVAKRGGLDFVGITCDDSGTPVLGAVQSEADGSAYAVLLRLLACLAEVAPEAQVRRLGGPCFRGTLRARPAFDINLVLFDEEEGDGSHTAHRRTTLAALTRDLAERMKQAIRAETRWPDLVRDVVCLRMNPRRFDGRLRYEWHV